jgi:MFS family permease
MPAWSWCRSRATTLTTLWCVDAEPFHLDLREPKADLPLQNWPRWRKELNFWALLFPVGLIGGMKTAFISTNGVMAVRYETSYTAVAALTGVPLVLSAFTGLASLGAARIWGKRPVYLASLALVFIGALWNMTTADDYGQCMAARVFQGLGWGAFDTLIVSSIQDTFFVRSNRILAHAQHGNG